MVTRTTSTTTWVTITWAKTGASSLQSMAWSIFWRPAGRDCSFIDELACPVHQLRLRSAYWLAPRLQSPSNAQAPFRQRVGLAQQVAPTFGGGNGATAHGLERARD